MADNKFQQNLQLIAFMLISYASLIVFCMDIHYSVIGKKLFCRGADDYFDNITCEIKQHNKTHQTYTLIFELSPDKYLDEMWVKFSMFHKDRTQIKYKTYIGINNVTLDLCKLLGGKERNPFFDVILQDLKKFGTAVQPCPVRGKIYLKDLVMDESKFLRFMPNGDYIMHSYYYSKLDGSDSFIGETKALFEIKPKKWI